MVLARNEVSKDAELLVLRHENAVLRRHIGRVRYQPADRLWLLALSRLIPRRRWGEVFAVTPATLLAPATGHPQMGLHQPGRVPAFVDARLLRACAVLGIKLVHSRPRGPGRDRKGRRSHDCACHLMAQMTPPSSLMASSSSSSCSGASRLAG